MVYKNKLYDPSLRDGGPLRSPACYTTGQQLAGAAPRTPLVGALRLHCEVGAARLQGETIIVLEIFIHIT